MSPELRLMLAIVEAEQAGFLHLRDAFISILKDRLNLSR